MFANLTTLADGPYSRRTPTVEAFEKNKDAVVNISTMYLLEVRDRVFSYDWDSFFYPRYRSRQVELSSLGSGFLIDPRGYIITNAHVVNRASKITVIMADESRHDAELISKSTENDLALLKINTNKPLTSVTLGNSGDLLIGETALAIGNPLGYQHTLTEGVVSAIHRELEIDNDFSLSNLIQVSTPINPGNSGGPLLNINGQVIGINTAINKAGQGIGFAIPIDKLKQTLPRILTLDALRRIDFGAQVATDPNSYIASPVIEHVLPNSQAEKLGLRPGDRITAVNDRQVNSALDFAIEMIEQPQDSRVKLTLARTQGSKTVEKKISLTLSQRPKPQGDLLARKLFGLELTSLTQQMIRKYDLHADPGDLIVLSVDKNSPAYAEGVETGDILVAVHGEKIPDLDNLGLMLEDTQKDQVVSFVFNRTQTRGWSVRVFQFEIELPAATDAHSVTTAPKRIDL